MPEAQESQMQEDQQPTPWERHGCLSFDGGGIRGYASLLILQRLMLQVERIERSREALRDLIPGHTPSTARSSFHPETCDTLPDEYLPCHYFDFMIGTSTGGLIAIMLSRFRMSVTAAIDQYKNLGGHIFGSPRRMHYRRLPPLFIPRTKFCATKLVKAVNDVCDKYGYAVRAECSFTTVALAQNHSGCKTLVTAMAAKRDTAIRQTTIVFRSYDTKRTDGAGSWMPGPACGLPVWMIARAITAAPTYFKPMNFPDSQGNLWDFKDGGLQANNPAKQGFVEVQRMTGKEPDLFVSIGTCHQRKSYFARTPGGIRDTLKAVMAFIEGEDPHQVHEDICNHPKHTEGKSYWRFEDNVSEKRGSSWKKIKMDQWKTGKNSTLKTMDKLVEEYLKEDAVEKMLKDCATALVKQRRLRALDRERWKEYALHDWSYE